MPLVSRSRVGSVAFERLVRDGTCTPLSTAFALPRDLSESPSLRALAVRDYVPAHTVLSGLAGLWVATGGTAPAILDVVGPRGLHRVATAASTAAGEPWAPAVAFHSGRAASEPVISIAGLTMANIGRCCIDALRWGRHADAIPAVTRAVRQGAVTVRELQAAFASDSPRGSGHARLRSVWEALAPALEQCSATTAARAASSQ